MKMYLLSLILLLLLWQNLYGQKRKTKITTSNTNSSIGKDYIDAATADSVLYYTTAAIFSTYKVPHKKFRERYFLVKQALVPLCKKEMADSLPSIKKNESGNPEREKELFITYYKQAIIHACATSKTIQQQLYQVDCDHIRFFQSHVTILPNGRLLVKEIINVYNTNGSSLNAATDNDSGFSNYDIKRGIYRSFPTVYMDAYKLSHEVDMDVKEVLLDGEKELYTLKKSDNGYYLQIGNPGVVLPEGRFVYSITYETDFQIKFLRDFDELYWNVTGNGWSFRIDSAACTLQLPAGASVLYNACYTGFQDDKESQCDVFYRRENDSLLATFKTNRPLAPKQGFTIATSWHKGIVTPPTPTDKFMRTVKSNLVIAIMGGVILLIVLFNFIAWLLVGKDPKRGNIFPQFTPPPGISPAVAGFLHGQGFNNRLVAATITELAVRNKIMIGVEREGLIFKSNTYKITASYKTGSNAPYHDFSADVQDLIGSSIQKGKYNPALGDLRKKVQEYCNTNYLKSKNRAGFLAMNSVYMGVGNTLAFVAFAALLFGVIPRTAKQNPWQLLYLVAGLIICIIIQKFYYTIIKSYTGEGRKIMDLIEGFYMYLRAADEQRINAMNPPKKTIALYEKYMPFAIALNCEIEWGRQFEDIITTASVTPSSSGMGTTHHSDFSDGSSFGASFASGLSGTISSASSPPSSSSGGGSSSDGGSSGGGGGGGGGGGW